MAEEEVNRYDFDEAFQERIATMFVRDTTTAIRIKDLVRPEYFTTEATQAVMRVTQDHLDIYRTAPGISLMPMLIKDAVVAKKIRKDTVPEIRDLLKRIMHGSMASPGFVIDKVADFAKHQAMEQAILGSVGMLEKGEFGKIADAMKAALAVGDAGEGEDYDFFKEIESRTKQREDILAGKVIKTGITSGYSEIDAHLYHAGWGRKELSCIMGPAKSGKSLSLGDFCKNAAIAGYNVLYVSLEVAHEIIAGRVDAALSDTMIKDLHKDPKKVHDAIVKMSDPTRGAGLFKMQTRASGTMKPSHLRAMLEKYRSDGINFDLVAVDYADIMAAEHRSDDLRENLRTIYIDLRALAHEYNIAMLTATQTNRAGAQAVTGKATDVGDDWNKARTVDILIGINATDAEKKAGQARLFWALSRNTEDGFTLRIKQDRSKMKFIEKVMGKEL